MPVVLEWVVIELYNQDLLPNSIHFFRVNGIAKKWPNTAVTQWLQPKTLHSINYHITKYNTLTISKIKLNILL